ncbi:MAG: DUF1566 domain-containing protein, partial [Polyangia bacterium]
TTGDATTLTGADGQTSTTATLGSTPGEVDQYFTATANGLDVEFEATATGHYIDYLFPQRMWPGSPIDIEIEIFGAGFDTDAEVIWDAGGAEQVLVPSTVEPERIVVTLPSALFDTARTVPVTVEQTADGRCASVDFVLGGVLPDTGQTLCYDNVSEITCPASDTDDFWGQDAQFGWDLYVTPAERFERSEPIADEPVVFDNITQLEWQGCASGLSGADCTTGTAGNYTWQEALDYCEALQWGGFDDWRVPNVRELSTLVDRATSYPAIDLVAFPQSPDEAFWSASTYRATLSNAWTVRFHVGYELPVAKHYTRHVRCVRGEP